MKKKYRKPKEKIISVSNRKPKEEGQLAGSVGRECDS